MRIPRGCSGVKALVGALAGAVAISFAIMAHAQGKGKAVPGIQGAIISREQFPKLEKEALLGVPESAFRLSLFFESVRLDMKEALYWLTIAAENGHAVAQYNLAVFLLEDRDTRSRQRARFWLKQASKQGHTKATELLKEVSD